jgi:hypothetical protein
MHINLQIQTALCNEMKMVHQADDNLFYTRLCEKINQLILHDFNALVNILYRMDVSEQKLKKMLQQNTNEDAAAVIASMIIEREAQKVKTREPFKKSSDEGSEEEKW